MTQERAIVFECEGEPLVAICSGGESAAAVGVLVVVGGPQYRVGCHRQFVHLSRTLAAAGYPVMRFDYRGMGDGGGDTQTFERTVPDIAAAIDTFKAACPAVERVVLWGLCDGASASLLYWDAVKDPRIAAMALLNPWVTSDDTFAKAQIRQSMKRLLQRKFWAEALSGGIDIPGAVRKLVSALSAAVKPNREPRAVPFQARMAAALKRFDGPVLVVLSGRDLIAMEFVELLRTDAEWRAVVERANVERYELAEADHTFSEPTNRTRVEAAMLAWLERGFGSLRQAAPPSASQPLADASRST